ncbi:hypothetical protein I551_3413 [Mycobacterium ulcerans str. Harvey]|uniref:Uncharacterized protein n=1 Tax=Mycobacterium ulcerans str. Harvey TaxID=1299332 RepID=A0ABP3AGM6_MYCUL|nr:hypothetical protein I551_3413 [Mycobacterium ulcerans str. Harvey]
MPRRPHSVRVHLPGQSNWIERLISPEYFVREARLAARTSGRILVDIARSRHHGGGDEARGSG